MGTLGLVRNTKNIRLTISINITSTIDNLTLNGNKLYETQISYSNFIIIHNQRKMEKSPQKKASSGSS